MEFRSKKQELEFNSDKNMISSLIKQAMPVTIEIHAIFDFYEDDERADKLRKIRFRLSHSEAERLLNVWGDEGLVTKAIGSSNSGSFMGPDFEIHSVKSIRVIK